MIVFDLKCAAWGHVFEAWFANSEAYYAQQQKHMLVCPVCGDNNVRKAAMAAAVPRKGNASPDALISTAANIESDGQAKALMAALAAAQGKMLESSQWVGRSFDSKARAMDSGEVEKSPIHGEVTGEEARALIEDGIAVTPLPFPVIPPEKRN